MKRAFTLIELLVVIAIIAILAAILFPVFAQAKAAAKKTQSLSNVKQICLGIQTYMGDTDDVFNTHMYRALGTTVTSPSGTEVQNPEIWWPRQIEPYTKNWQIFQSPGVVVSHPSWGSKATDGGWWYNWQRWPEFGFNVEYLNPAPGDCAQWGATVDPGLRAFGLPISGTAVASPADTVLLANSKIVNSAGTYLLSARIGAPASPNAPEICTYSNWGWGVGSSQDVVGGYPTNPTSTGGFANAYANSGNVAFVDGHVKSYQPGRLAAGTNWRVGIKNTDVVINDRSQYLWDTQQ